MDKVEHSAEQWRLLHPDMDVDPLLVVGRVQRLWALWDDQLRGIFAEAGLHSGDFDVLAALRRTDRPVTPGDLARSMLVTAGATTKRVDRLNEAGLVERVDRGDGDGRQRPVQLTPTGIATADRLMRAHLANEARLLESLSAREQQELATLLSRLLAASEGPAQSPTH